ncbi:MAG: TonB-dependent receptor, partial [Petrimonas mucosa]
PVPFRESLKPLYTNLAHTHVGGMIRSNIWSPLDLSVRVKKSIYTVEETGITDAKAYGKPGFEAGIQATYAVMSNLELLLNYYFAGDRWSYFNDDNVKMDNINDLNLGAHYNINESFSIQLKANNLLLQKYDIWYGYPAQGFNVMGGFTFKF